MRPLLIFVLFICWVHVVWSATTSEEKTSRHRNDSAELSKSKSQVKEGTSASRQKNDSPDAIIPKPKSRKGGSSRKSSRRRDRSSEEHLSKSKRKGGKSRKEDVTSESDEKDIKPKVNTEQVNFKFWNFENLGNYKNNHNNNGNDNGPQDNSD